MPERVSIILVLSTRTKTTIAVKHGISLNIQTGEHPPTTISASNQRAGERENFFRLYRETLPGFS